MAIVFAAAPIVNAVASTLMHPPKGGWGGIAWQFWAGILLAAVGGCLVSYYKPPPHPRSPRPRPRRPPPRPLRRARADLSRRGARAPAARGAQPPRRRDRADERLLPPAPSPSPAGSAASRRSRSFRRGCVHHEGRARPRSGRAPAPTARRSRFQKKPYTRFHQTSGTSGRPIVWLDTRRAGSGSSRTGRRSGAARPRAGDAVFFAFSFGPFLGFWTAFRLGAAARPAHHRRRRHEQRRAAALSHGAASAPALLHAHLRATPNRRRAAGRYRPRAAPALSA